MLIGERRAVSREHEERLPRYTPTAAERRLLLKYKRRVRRLFQDLARDLIEHDLIDLLLESIYARVDRA